MMTSTLIPICPRKPYTTLMKFGKAWSRMASLNPRMGQFLTQTRLCKGSTNLCCGSEFSLRCVDNTNNFVLNRSMAQKESHHREVVEDLNTQLSLVRRQHDELTTLSRDQVCVNDVYVLRESQLLL